MKWLAAALAGILSGWIISEITGGVAIAALSGAAIGTLTTIALFGTRPVHSLAKAVIAMGIGCLFGWLISAVTGGLTIPMILGLATGVFATIALTSERPVRSLLKVIVVMGIGVAAGWGVGYAIGHHGIGMALTVLPLCIPLLILFADTVRPPRHRPF